MGPEAVPRQVLREELSRTLVKTKQKRRRTARDPKPVRCKVTLC